MRFTYGRYLFEVIEDKGQHYAAKRINKKDGKEPKWNDGHTNYFEIPKEAVKIIETGAQQ